MTLNVRDADQVVQALKSTLDAGEHVTHHHIDSLPGVVATAPIDQLVTAGGTVLPIHFVPVSVSGSGDNELVAAVGGQTIRLLGLVLVAAAPVTATLTGILGPLPLGATVPLMLPVNPLGWGEGGVGANLNLHLGAGIPVAGGLVYVTY